uniref:Uncharacterized protein n=1 Tax=Oryza sativa subsp. japonica TaxID=39947 RepID=Q6ZK54_ORYSJ|nr:hypothetical protein [Oryza sativa Japonica Group]
MSFPHIVSVCHYEISNSSRTRKKIVRNFQFDCTAYRNQIDYSIPLASVHRRSGEQVSGTSVFDVLHREKTAIRFLGSVSRDCYLFIRDGSPSSPLTCCAPLSTLATASSSCRATGLSANSNFMAIRMKN